jgi:DNA-binding response OmpR family regulator
MADGENKKIVLIVEDDEFLRSLAVTKLQGVGFDVEIAPDGVEGLQKIDEHSPHLLLLDLMLPNLDGFGVLEKLKEAGKLDDLKVIVFSNMGSEEDIRRATAYGITEYIVKSSFTLDELVEKIQGMLQ